jgi:hypothetical protein
VGEESDAGLGDVQRGGLHDGLVHALDVRLEAFAEVLRQFVMIFLSKSEKGKRGDFTQIRAN